MKEPYTDGDYPRGIFKSAEEWEAALFDTIFWMFLGFVKEAGVAALRGKYKNRNFEGMTQSDAIALAHEAFDWFEHQDEGCYDS